MNCATGRSGKPAYLDMNAKKVMNRVNSPSMPFQWSINPYRGCLHGCSFCYARETHTYLGFQTDDAFQKQIFVKSNAAESLRTQLQHLARRAGGVHALAQRVGPVAIGTATDPYQPVEAKAGITRACLEVLAEYGIPVTITTRSSLILRDIDLLKEMDVRSVHMSINTLNTLVWRNLEPASPAPVRRFETVARLVDSGIHAGIFLAPILPHLTDAPVDVDAVLRSAREFKAQFVLPSVLRLTPQVKTWFYQTLKHRYPALLPAYERLYRSSVPPRSYVDAFMSRISRQMDRYGFASTLRLDAMAPVEARAQAGPINERDLRDVNSIAVRSRDLAVMYPRQLVLPI